jgi:hypothetical protein
MLKIQEGATLLHKNHELNVCAQPCESLDVCVYIFSFLLEYAYINYYC